MILDSDPERIKNGFLLHLLHSTLEPSSPLQGYDPRRWSGQLEKVGSFAREGFEGVAVRELADRVVDQGAVSRLIRAIAEVPENSGITRAFYGQDELRHLFHKLPRKQRIAEYNRIFGRTESSHYANQSARLAFFNDDPSLDEKKEFFRQTFRRGSKLSDTGASRLWRNWLEELKLASGYWPRELAQAITEEVGVTLKGRAVLELFTSEDAPGLTQELRGLMLRGLRASKDRESRTQAEILEVLADLKSGRGRLEQPEADELRRKTLSFLVSKPEKYEDSIWEILNSGRGRVQRGIFDRLLESGASGPLARFSEKFGENKLVESLRQIIGEQGAGGISKNLDRAIAMFRIGLASEDRPPALSADLKAGSLVIRAMFPYLDHSDWHRVAEVRDQVSNLGKSAFSSEVLKILKEPIEGAGLDEKRLWVLRHLQEFPPLSIPDLKILLDPEAIRGESEQVTQERIRLVSLAVAKRFEEPEERQQVGKLLENLIKSGALGTKKVSLAELPHPVFERFVGLPNFQPLKAGERCRVLFEQVRAKNPADPMAP